MSDLLAEPPARRGYFRLLFVCLLVVGLGNSMLFAVLPPLARQLHLPESSVGAVYSLSALIWVFASPFWGRRSDHVGRKPIVALGLGAYSVSMGLFALSVIAGLAGLLAGTSLFLALMCSRALFGAVGSAASPAAQAYVADRTSRAERTQEIAALTAAFSLGSAIGPAMAALPSMGLVAPIVLTCALAAAAALAIWRFLPETSLPQLEGGAQSASFAQSWRLAADPRIAAYLIVGVSLSTITGILNQTYTFYLMDRLHVEGETAKEWAGAGFMVAALALLATQLALLPRLRLAPRGLIVIGAALLALGVLMQMASPNLGGLLVAQMLQGFGFGLARPGFAGGASMAVRPREQGAAAGLVVATNGAGFVVSPLFGGLAYERLGLNAPLWIALAMIAAIGLFAILSRRLKAASRAAAPPTDAP